MDLDDIYSERILELAGNLPVTPSLVSPDACARRTSRICGSTIEVQLQIKDKTITGYAHDVNACALGQTSSAVVAQRIVGSTCDEFRAVRDRMCAMLKAAGAPPRGKWEDLKYLQPVRDFNARHASTLLVFEAVVDAIDAYELKKKS